MASIAERRRELGDYVMSKRRVYLDVKFWVYLRDAFLGVAVEPTHLELYRLLSELVDAGICICPIEQHVFLEAYKQGDVERRLAVTRVVDTLSQGITLISQQNRMIVEVREFVSASFSGPPFPAAPVRDMWTRIAYILGHGELTSSTMNTNDLQRLNARLQERLWGFSLEDMLNQLGPNFPMPDSGGASTAELLNREKIDPTNQFGDRRRLYLSEIRGIFDVYAGTLGDVTELFYRTVTGAENELDERQRSEAGSKLALILSAAFENHDLAHQLPTAHVLATLFTAVQWDTGRKYKPNDFPDFGHAAAALPYFDLFLTERSLATLVEQTGLAGSYETQVIVSPADAIDHLKGWGAS